jgi:hypothetical protein
MPSVATRPLFRMLLTTPAPSLLGAAPFGTRRLIPVNGGSFEGDRLKGAVLSGGSDWQSIGTDGSVHLDVRLVLQTDDGAVIGFRYRGLRTGTPEVLARIDRGETVDPSAYYMRTSGLFETSAARYLWLNHIVAVSIGTRTSAGPQYDVYEVL